MKKSELAAGVLGGMLVLGGGECIPNHTGEQTNKNLIEAMTSEQSESADQANTIQLDVAMKLQEDPWYLDEMLKDEEIEKLVEKYGKEEVEKMIIGVVSNDDVKWVIKEALEDPTLQHLMEEGNYGELKKILSNRLDYEKDTSAIFVTICIALSLVLVKKYENQKEENKSLKELLEGTI